MTDPVLKKYAADIKDFGYVTRGLADQIHNVNGGITKSKDIGLLFNPNIEWVAIQPS